MKDIISAEAAAKLERQNAAEEAARIVEKARAEREAAVSREREAFQALKAERQNAQKEELKELYRQTLAAGAEEAEKIGQKGEAGVKAAAKQVVEEITLK